VVSVELHRALAEIRATLSAIQQNTAATRADVDWIKRGMERGSARMDDHDKRIGSLERTRSWYAGVSALAGGMVTYAVAFFMKSKL
jgi:hypothetical protein